MVDALDFIEFMGVVVNDVEEEVVADDDEE